MLFRSIASGGNGALPYLVDEVTVEGESTYRAQTQKDGTILSAKTAEILRGYLQSNVQNVYGSWNFPGMTVCGKSGTSQLGGGQTSNAMFAGFVTDEEYPLAFICVVENGGYGASTCVPVLSQVLGACRTVLDGE